MARASRNFFKDIALPAFGVKLTPAQRMSPATGSRNSIRGPPAAALGLPKERIACARRHCRTVFIYQPFAQFGRARHVVDRPHALTR